MLKMSLIRRIPGGLFARPAHVPLNRRFLCSQAKPPLPPREPLSENHPFRESAPESTEVDPMKVTGPGRRTVSAFLAEKGGMIVLGTVGGIIGSFFAYTALIVYFIASG